MLRIKLLLITLLTLFTTNCSTATGAVSSGFSYSQFGILYTNIKDSKLETIPTGEIPWSPNLKIGRSSCKQYIFMVALGDCTIEKAMRKANITKVHHVDYEIYNILLIYMESVTKVYGE